MTDHMLGGETPRSRVRALTLVRHGATAWSRSGRHTGRTDLELDEKGREEAVELGERLSVLSIGPVRSSPLRRAHDTAELLGLGRPIVIDDDLLEWDYGKYEGLTSAEIHATRPDWDLFTDGCPGGESPDEVVARAEAVLARFELDPTVDEVGLLVAHGHILRVLAACYLGFAVTAARHLLLEPAHLSVLGLEHEHHALERWNLGPLA